MELKGEENDWASFHILLFEFVHAESRKADKSPQLYFFSVFPFVKQNKGWMGHPLVWKILLRQKSGFNRAKYTELGWFHRSYNIRSHFLTVLVPSSVASTESWWGVLARTQILRHTQKKALAVCFFGSTPKVVSPSEVGRSSKGGKKAGASEQRWGEKREVYNRFEHSKGSIL